MKKSRKSRARLRQVHIVPPAQAIENEVDTRMFLVVVFVSFIGTLLAIIAGV